MDEEIRQDKSDTDVPLRSVNDLEEALEAIIYAAGHPMRFDKLAEVLGIQPRDVRQLVNHMAANFNEERHHHGIMLLVFSQSCQFATKEIYAPYIREALGIRRGGNLSASSMEVLAVVAYNQPCTRTFIDQVRGVDSAYAVTSLLDKGLIEACGRLDAPGRPMLYGTTEKFLRVFGLQSLYDLPETESLAVADAKAESETGAVIPLTEEEKETAAAETNEENVGKQYAEADDAEEESTPEAGTAAPVKKPKKKPVKPGKPAPETKTDSAPAEEAGQPEEAKPPESADDDDFTDPGITE